MKRGRFGRIRTSASSSSALVWFWSAIHRKAAGNFKSFVGAQWPRKKSGNLELLISYFTGEPFLPGISSCNSFFFFSFFFFFFVFTSSVFRIGLLVFIVTPWGAWQNQFENWLEQQRYRWTTFVHQFFRQKRLSYNVKLVMVLSVRYTSGIDDLTFYYLS